MKTRALAFAFASGLLFALGLCLSGMTRPSKVVGFLDVTGDWDPSLAFVMGGALLVMIAAVAVARRREGSPGAARLHFSRREGIDARLVIGSALFGVGWGISGFCPGPAVVSVGGAGSGALLFAAFMVAGMAAQRFLLPRPRAAAATGASGTTSEICG